MTLGDMMRNGKQIFIAVSTNSASIEGVGVGLQDVTETAMSIATRQFEKGNGEFVVYRCIPVRRITTKILTQEIEEPE